MNRELEERMAELRARFVARSISEKPDLMQALAAMDRVEMRRIAHGMAGGAGLFGCPALGRAASALEVTIVDEGSDLLVQAMCGKLLAELDLLIKAQPASH